MLHGFGDTPQTLALMAARINHAGFSVSVPLLPGHGTTPEEFFRSTAEEWVSAARESFLRLRGACATVAVAGLSMGGAIAAILAAEFRDIDSLVLLAPYVGMPFKLRAAAATQWIWGRAVGPIKSRNPDSIRDPVEREKNLGYGVTNGHALRELWKVVREGRAALPSVTSPALVLQSHRDPRVAPSVAIETMSRLGAPKKKLVWADEGGHIITVDYGREKVFEETLAWLLANQPSSP
jgi:carboxylesterase